MFSIDLVGYAPAHPWAKKPGPRFDPAPYLPCIIAEEDERIRWRKLNLLKALIDVERLSPLNAHRLAHAFILEQDDLTRSQISAARSVFRELYICDDRILKLLSLRPADVLEDGYHVVSGRLIPMCIGHLLFGRGRISYAPPALEAPAQPESIIIPELITKAPLARVPNKEFCPSKAMERATSRADETGVASIVALLAELPCETEAQKDARARLCLALVGLGKFTVAQAPVINPLMKASPRRAEMNDAFVAAKRGNRIDLRKLGYPTIGSLVKSLGCTLN